MDGRKLLNFSSNDYLGLSNHPRVKEAAIRAVEQFGAGSGASRLICGSLAPHHRLEEALAAFKGTAACLAFSSGYATALGAITSFATKDDVVILDRLSHASLIDAARLSGAKLRVFAHNDLDDLERILRWATARRAQAPAGASSRRSRILVVTESVFSMDGDHAPLAQMVALKERFGAWLLVDEAHATGLYGCSGRGLADSQGVAGRIDIQMGTLGKALGAAGGYICGSRPLIELLINRARSFIFSTAPVPASAAAAQAALEIVQGREGDELRLQLWDRVAQLRTGLAQLAGPRGFGLSGEVSPSEDSVSPANKPGSHQTAAAAAAPSAILPLIIGPEAGAVSMAEQLQTLGFYVPAIRYPTVGRGQARLRLTLTAAHQPQEVAQLLDALSETELKPLRH
jgi:8-amino-7-oxononanoate synthase